MSDVIIKYSNQNIGQLDDSGTALLKTNDKKCISDIEVEYTKSASDAPPCNIVNITNNSSGTPQMDGSGIITSNGVYYWLDYPYTIAAGNSKVFLFNSFIEDSGYSIALNIYAPTDVYTVTVNGGEPISFGNGQYTFEINEMESPLTGQTYNIVITDNIPK